MTSCWIFTIISNMAAVGGVCPFGVVTVVETCAWPKTPETVVGSIPAPISKLVCKCPNHMKTHRSNDLAFIDHYVDHLTSVIPVNAVVQPESERYAVQIKICPALLVNYHLVQQLTVNLGAVAIR